MVNTRTGEFDWTDFWRAGAAMREGSEKRARRRRAWRVRGRLMRRAWREVRRSRLAAVTAGVWIAVALVRAFEFVGN